MSTKFGCSTRADDVPAVAAVRHVVVEAGRHHVVTVAVRQEVLGDAGRDGGAARDGERSALAEIVLDVDDEQRGPNAERSCSQPARSNTRVQRPAR